MDVQRLVTMANDIARYFASEPDREAGIEAVADHLRKFWTPRMREQIVAYRVADGDGMDELTRHAIERLSADRVADG